jgi:hypothetical protein
MRIVYGADAYYPRISGQVVSIESLKQYFEEQGHEVHIFVPEYGSRSGPDRDRVYRFKSFIPFFTSSTEDRLVYKSEKKKVYDLLDRIEPDIIHIHTEFTLSKILLRYAKEQDIPLVVTSHTHYEEYITKYMPYVPKSLGRHIVKTGLTEIHRDADAAIVPSREMLSVLRSYDINGDLKIIPTGIRLADFADVDKGQEKEESFLYRYFPALRGRRILLFVGRLGEEKNVPFLFTVLKRLLKEEDMQDLALLIVGEGRYGKKLRQMVEWQGLEDRVFFTGYLNRSKLKYVYALADVFTFPSKTETQGLVTIEAMAAGTPVIAIGEMGTKDVMQGDNGGYMVSDDPDEFSRRTRELLADPELYRKKSREAVEYAHNFALEKVGRKTAEVYESILAGHSKS